MGNSPDLASVIERGVSDVALRLKTQLEIWGGKVEIE